ncbi:5-oxoprolinase subunit PxpB [Clostridium sp. MCC353]|uniref:5-oxoprolinase subunit PxpB n=1 Tax=Clostridium sp. MCC353 TaxID=2592646 RepID=UPI001C01C3F4|nr:5-oxoprolinase subunit PxpB [Clostridium sp. MCC353]MBT9775635.1 5-oxoprolinase subunit PxpB [Clostridium sp. MCC353]
MAPRFLLNGDSAVSVELGTEINIETSKKVRALMAALETCKTDAIVETVPAYASLMIHYRPELMNIYQLKELVSRCLDSGEKKEQDKAVITEIPVLYGGDTGMDLEECARMEGISVPELISIHSGFDYYVYMLGFAPGHPYCARMERPFSFKRRTEPRIKVGAGSVVVSGELSNILPFDQPCGWNVIGNTPVKLCDYSKPEPFLLEAGRWIRFIPVSEPEYKEILREAELGNYKCRELEKVVEH